MHASYVLPLLAILPTTLGHFLLNYPDPLGTFDDDNEPNGPCGGYDLSFSGNVTNVSVSGFSVATRSTHPQGSWLFRYTTTITEPYNWTNILPVVSQSGIGDFCLPALTVPDSLVGQQAVIQVIDQAVDGNLYQVSFVLTSDFWERLCLLTLPKVCSRQLYFRFTISAKCMHKRQRRYGNDHHSNFS